MARKQEEIQQEYGRLCAECGEKAFQIKVLQAEIEQRQERIIALGKEMQDATKELADKLSQAQPVEAPKEEVKSEVSPS